jgi:hypothetical protein
MHKKPPRNPHEPSVRERLAQRESAMSAQAYKVTGKRKYAVSKPLDLAAKLEMNALYGSGGYSIYWSQSRGMSPRTGNKTSNFIIIDYESWEPVGKVEERWLTERQATMLRLKGFIVEDT